MSRIKRALLSVSNKNGLVDFAKALHALDVELLSTGGTARLLSEEGIPVTEVGDYTGFPEMLDGRLKTLHPKIHGGLLGIRDNPEHAASMRGAGIEPIDLVVVNLYPFRETVAAADCTLERAIENIDIGGPAMLRSAAKNHHYVGVVTNPEDYPHIARELADNAGGLSHETRFDLARKAFTHTAQYDQAISDYLWRDDAARHGETLPQHLNLSLTKLQDLRYGENPHQSGAFYRDPELALGTLANFKQLQGKELSYNNIADSDAAWECVKTFDQPACVIVKHANPCGASEAPTLREAYANALQCDPTSAFGGIIAFNRELDAETATALIELFVEVIVAPGVASDASAVFARKANVRVLSIPNIGKGNKLDFKRVGGGVLVQSADARNVTAPDLKVVTQAQPTPQQLVDLIFAWRVAKFVKSNAIVFAADGRTLGIGAGQMSRVDSTRIAAWKAQNAGLNLSGSAVASDAFFPFRDGVDVVAEAGARAIIQPGGSMRDAEVIAAADEHGIAMVYTGVRHFRH